MEPLTRETLDPDPVRQFGRWFEAARTDEALPLHRAMCLSTVSPEGRPEGRFVLLKDFGDDGFVFYTNLESEKGRSLSVHPVAELTFYWEPLRRQVRIRGPVREVTDEEADAYFRTRPRGSRLSAWASQQSAVLEDREELVERFRELEAGYEGEEVPRPPYWSGYRVLPDRFEFWEERDDRLHARFRYARGDDGWRVEMLAP